MVKVVYLNQASKLTFLLVITFLLKGVQAVQVQQEKMPLRNAAQKLKHNEQRREFMKVAKKAIFCINHVKQTYPSIVEDASKIYDYLYEIYPTKRDLARTEIYRNVIIKKNNQPEADSSIMEKNTQLETGNRIKKNQLEAVIRIPLIQNQTSNTPTTETTVQRQQPEQMEVSTAEISPTVPAMSELEATAIIRELQADPDLDQFFKQEITYQETEGVQELSHIDEIDRIIQEEFLKLGNDLADLTTVDEELMCS